MWGVREYDYPGYVARSETALYRATANEPWKVSGFHVNVLSRADIATRSLNFMSEPPGVQGVIAAAPEAAADAGMGGPTPAEQLARLGELARANPKEAASVLRGWMNER